jgi:hypothetical protein
MTGRDAGPANGLGLADAIALLRDQLLEAQVFAVAQDVHDGDVQRGGVRA